MFIETKVAIVAMQSLTVDIGSTSGGMDIPYLYASRGQNVILAMVVTLVSILSQSYLNPLVDPISMSIENYGKIFSTTSTVRYWSFKNAREDFQLQERIAPLSYKRSSE